MAVSHLLNKAEIVNRLLSHQPLFVVLDAARDPRVLQLLGESDAVHQSLYEGEKGAELAAFAPYLVALDSPSNVVLEAVEQGWGESWGIYLSSPEPFEVVRHQLRRFLMVKQPDGQQVYFRFYDPRVLRAFLPSLNAEERSEFFGPIDCFLLEGESATDLLIFKNDSGV